MCPKSDISGISLLPQLKPLRFYLGGPRINKLPCGRCWSEQQVIKRRLGAKRELCTNKFRKYSKVHTNAGRYTKFTKNRQSADKNTLFLWNFKVYEDPLGYDTSFVFPHYCAIKPLCKKSPTPSPKVNIFNHVNSRLTL